MSEMDLAMSVKSPLPHEGHALVFPKYPMNFDPYLQEINIRSCKSQTSCVANQILDSCDVSALNF